MKIIEKVKIKSSSKKIIGYRLFGIPFLMKISGSKNFQILNVEDIFLLLKKISGDFYKKNNNTQVFFLKVNKFNVYTFINLQHWIDIVELLGADFFIICDNPILKKHILKNIVFPNLDVKFIKSCKCNKLKKIVKNVATGLWGNATYAHLTSFYYADKFNINYFWNIDADDTFFSLPPENCAELLKQVKDYSINNKIDVFSLDMWRSCTFDRHWSFGVTFVNNKNNSNSILNLIQDTCKNNWQEKYAKYVVEYNLDWFFNYLKDNKLLGIETFYVENCMFFHCADFYNTIGGPISYWHNGKIYYPILLSVYGNKNLGVIPIANNCVKFDLGLNKEYSQNYAIQNISCLRNIPEQLKSLHNIN